MLQQIVFYTIFIVSLIFQTPELPESEKVYWNDRKLTWNDFKGTPDLSSLDAAISACNIRYSVEFIGDSIECSIVCYLNKSNSWVKLFTKDEYSLEHEQNHFNIAEIYARKFRQTVATYKLYKTTLKKDLKILFTKNWQEYDAYQDLYDKETDHGQVVMEQKEWNKRVEQELKELDKYSNPLVVVLIGK